MPIPTAIPDYSSLEPPWPPSGATKATLWSAPRPVIRSQGCVPSDATIYWKSSIGPRGSSAGLRPVPSGAPQLRSTRRYASSPSNQSFGLVSDPTCHQNVQSRAQNLIGPAVCDLIASLYFWSMVSFTASAGRLCKKSCS